MLKKLAAVGLAILCSGCAFNLKLLEDGKVHPGQFDPIGGTMSATIDGDPYQGPLTRGMQAGFMTGVVGTRFMSGTMIGGLDQFQALMTNKAGRVLRCQIQSIAGTGQGVCQANDGRLYDVLVGRATSEGMFVK